MECKEPVYVMVTSVPRELVRYTLDLVGVKEVRWEQGITLLVTEKETKIINWKQDFLNITEQYQQ